MQRPNPQLLLLWMTTIVVIILASYLGFRIYQDKQVVRQQQVQPLPEAPISDPEQSLTPVQLPEQDDESLTMDRKVISIDSLNQT